MNEDMSHQGSGSEGDHGPPLDLETVNEITGKFIENSSKAAAASELVHGKGARLQSKLSEMHNNPVRHLPYGLQMSAEGSVIGSGDWRNQGRPRESSVHWSSLLPVSNVAHTDRNVPFQCSLKVPNCGTNASASNRDGTTERIEDSESGLIMNWKETMDLRPGREQEQFNLWKIASLIRGISPSDKEEKKNLDIRDEMIRRGSLMDDRKTTERLWTFGQNDHHLKMKSFSGSGAVSYPIFGSEAESRDLDPMSKSQLVGENTSGDQFIDNRAVIRKQGECPADDPFVPSVKTAEQLPGNRSTDGFARMKLSRPESSNQLPRNAANQHEAQTRDMGKGQTSVKATMSEVDNNHTASTTGDSDNNTGDSDRDRSLLHDDNSSRCVPAAKLATLPTESASSGLALPASSPPASESSNNGISLYRRRVKSLLLKQGNSLPEGFQGELPRSPRIQNRFGSAFEHGDSSPEVDMPDNVCGNFHREKCHEEHRDKVNSETLCNSLTESECSTEHVANTGCHSGRPLDQEKVSKSNKVSGTSCGVVNYAIVSSESMDENYRPRVSGIDCCYTGELVKDGVRSGCVEMNVAGLYSHGGCGTASHSVCQCYTDVSARRPSPSCHLPVKASPAAVCDVAAKCCVAHHLGALPTPTRACAAALCQLSIPSHVGSPKGMDTFTGCQFSRPKSGTQCTTPCHQAVVKCACVRDGYLAPGHQSACPHSVTKSSVRGCLPKIIHPDHVQHPGDTEPHTPCMAHTPYTPREAYTAREPETPQESNGVCEPCTPQSLCSHRARKYPHTSTAACYFQFPPLHAGQLDCSTSGLCQSPCVSYARRLPSCHTPCMSPLNLTIGQSCIAHTSTPQCCCFQHQKLPSCVSHRRHNCVCFICLFLYIIIIVRKPGKT